MLVFIPAPPTTPTTKPHTTKPHTPKPEIPATVCHIVIIFIIFLWHKTIFPIDPYCVSSWMTYSLKQALPEDKKHLQIRIVSAYGAATA